MPGNLRVSSVECGDSHTCFLSIENQVYTTGANTFGQLGHGNMTPSTIPKLVEALHDITVSRVFCGPTQTAVTCTNGMLYTWGDSKSAQLGHGFFVP